MHSVSQRIKYYRKKRGLTQVDVATAMGIRTDNYAKYESGARVPRTDRLVRLAKTLGVTYDALNEGVERGFLDLLRSYAIGIIVGDTGPYFISFVSDMELSGEAYYAVSDFLNRGEHTFAANNASFYQKYLSRPSLASLIELYALFREHCDSNPSEQTGDEPLTLDYRLNSHLDAITTTKWAFCIAVKKYLERNESWTILDEAEELAKNILEYIDPLQFFGVKVFVPYLSLIIDAVELCMNTTMDDFEKAFLFDALTPQDDDDTDDEGDDD